MFVRCLFWLFRIDLEVADVSVSDLDVSDLDVSDLIVLDLTVSDLSANLGEFLKCFLELSSGLLL